MSQLTVYLENDPGTVVEATEDGARIADLLNQVGVRFERWEADREIAADATEADIKEAYKASIDKLIDEEGFQTVDVIHMKPDHPDKVAFRTKFLREHRHTEDEVRFFVEGGGLFFLHIDGKVFRTHCMKGDLISVPANTPHWFDMGTQPEFTAIRFFNNPEGWVAHHTGSDISDLYPLMAFDVDMILTDIEGTTSSISFVKDVLFPYADQKMHSFLKEHGHLPQVANLMEDVRNHVEEPHANLDRVTEILRTWIAEDRKITPLKTLQGLIWEAGYKNGDYRAHVYEDAVVQIKHWRSLGKRIGVYSSGSIHAQKMFFEHSESGNLLGQFDEHFDTTVGNKKEHTAYVHIAEALQMLPQRILFLSDVKEELDAAREAGMETVWVVRDGKRPQIETHTVVSNFHEIAVI
jgi:enolase-phosphatase E1